MLLFGQLVKERQGRGLGDGACVRSYDNNGKEKKKEKGKKKKKKKKENAESKFWSQYTQVTTKSEEFQFPSGDLQS
ncbi:hypothetical protein IFM47457_11232 [Aspergillus lentulus]|nr:hypothetical protein IFM47457_11232 [Aspergillus lentulus]